jgi:protoporphyrinogen/coproporphyrinogen III oxidase
MMLVAKSQAPQGFQQRAAPFLSEAPVTIATGRMILEAGGGRSYRVRFYGRVRIVVIGGGIAGLAAAHRVHELAGNAVDILILDRADRLGGKIRTGSLVGVPIETGAETFLVREQGTESAVLDLARRVGLGDDLVHPEPVGAAVALGGALHKIPAGTLLGIPGPDAELDGLATLDADKDRDRGTPLLGAGEDIAVGALVRQRYGYDVVNHLVEPMLGGVYAGRADRLSLAATVPALHQAAQHEHTLAGAVQRAMRAAPRPPGTPVFASVRGGLSRLVEAIADRTGADVRLGAPVRELTSTARGWELTVGSTRDPVRVTADRVILATPAAPAARLLRGVDRTAADLVARLNYASVVLVSLALPPNTGLPELSGFLVPPIEDFTVKAATFFGTKWAHLDRESAVFVRASLGRYGDERVLQRTDEDLAALALDDLRRLLDRPLRTPLATRVTRWGGGLPQYGVGHVGRVVAARAQLPGTLALAGAAYDGIGIAACVRSGETAADVVLRGEGEWRT